MDASGELHHPKIKNQTELEIFRHQAVGMVREVVPELSAHVRMTTFQWGLFGVCITNLLWITAMFPAVIISAFVAGFSAFCLFATLLRVWLVIAAIGRGQPSKKAPTSSPPQNTPQNMPMITILLPLYKEANCLPGLIKEIEKLNWPGHQLDVKLLLEADDRATIEVATWNCPDQGWEIMIIPEGGPKTKPKACNYGLLHAKGEYIVIYDAEDRPEPDQLKLAVAGFEQGDEKLACLQARLNFYNPNETWVTRLFTLEYTLLFDWLLPGFARLGAPIPLGGTSNFFKTDILRRCGGWDAFNVTEDADLGLRLDAAGFATDVFNSTTWEEAVSDLGPWLRQRSRWIKGYLQTWLVHCRHRQIGFRRLGWQNALTTHLFMGGVILSALANPIFLALWFAIVLGLVPGIGALTSGLLTFCAIIQIGLLAFAAQRRGWIYLMPAALLAPLYWLAQSLAGYKAFWQFFINPFYWEKTDHACVQIFKDETIT
ncbi:MAG: glycosyltransferase family 2 protein [Parvularculaceae bacterium]